MKIILYLFLMLILCAVQLSAQVDALETSTLKMQSLEELMDMEVTSLSKHHERVFDAAASVFVITQEDIRLSGATTLPEALRLAPTIDVAQIDARQWDVSMRGFNGATPNKLLVLIDGRSVYTPLYSGILWDAQHVMLHDIERIEVISGPGATVWGANAVNGVINIITKGADELSSQGLYVTENIGSQEQSFAGIRYGKSLSENIAFRIYAITHDREEVKQKSGKGLGDPWALSQGGFRVDYTMENHSAITLQGDLYKGFLSQNGISNSAISGGNIQARWTRAYEDGNNMNLQVYFDNTYRNHPLIISQALTTCDIDFQHELSLATPNDFTWGLGYRYLADRLGHGVFLAVLPDFLVSRLYSGFLQYEFSLADNKGKITLGSKFEHNDFSGFEYQPSIKFFWSFNSEHKGWAAISRAVRTPSRFDRDLYLPGNPPFILDGGPNVTSEKVIAFEGGYRTQLNASVTAQLALSYNLYDDLVSIEPAAPKYPPFPMVVSGNGLEGTTYGTELSFNVQFTDWCHLRAGYTYLHKDIRLKSWSSPGNLPDGYRDTPSQGTLVAFFELPFGLEIDVTGRIVDERSHPTFSIPSYAEADVRVGYAFTDYISASIVGRNLLHDEHVETINPPAGYQIPRSVYGKLELNF